ncbi:M20/M25/M40 family metallo-hydrolase [Novosphingobium sp. MMS21-SN21R]|uniref:M20/M25/M40 family metallo-hydrolase n=1 Tax=Novosphingobium sp. MMS21-SN21R TaxID=2969298 RepID=UPI00288594C0|nr:M20/M25/M40 family metallo-hydrolase [Novosphingobium sp. MMS21-SN21R]MDT0507147.1 M20/M25/M40 family metallo-hydrolase [Novosphingobium sp. MMS21-SN21R]
MNNRLCAVASATVIAACISAAPVAAGPAEDRLVTQILDEGLNRSDVMETASELMDRIGPRLTNSENHRKAEEWAVAKFSSYGLKNIHREPFEFGLGWNLKSFSATMTTPRSLPLTVLPVAWSPATGGTVSAPVIVAPMSKVENFDAWKGKLAGKIVLVSLPGDTSESKEPPFKRLSAADIAEDDLYTLPRHDPEGTALQTARRGFLRKLSVFLKGEGALAMVRMTYRDGKLVHGEGYDFTPGETLALPVMDMAQEDYRRLVRLAKTGAAPQLSLSIDASYDDKDLMADNVIAEIPGTDPKAGYVMAGAHFDSWIAGDGAADNGAGSVAVIEAARLIAKMGVRPKRTIRFALWSGEEQGLLGSKAYIEQHLATRPVDPALKGIDSYSAWRNAYPITPKAGYADLKAYFNMDNGSGKFRGIYAEGNIGAASLLREWLAPFNSLGADKVVMSKTGGTDHVYLQAIGLPGYQFIQDPLDYESRVHHSSLDTLDHMRADDMRQASVILAGMLLQAAMSDKELPRSPLPTKPDATDPFKVQDPNQ